jgi:hypothetical protein
MALEHPALKNFSPTWEGIKHVAGKALKWAAWGAVGLGALVIAPAGIVGIGAKIASLVGIGQGTAGTALLIGGLTKGATIGAALGAISGIAGVGKAIREGREDAIDDYDRNLLARERAVLLARGRGQSFANSEVSVGNVAYRTPMQSQGRTVG